MKKKWIYIIIIFLLAGNLALIATLLLKPENKQLNNMTRRHFQDKKAKGHSGKFTYHLSNSLNFNAEQKTKLRSISNDFNNKRLKLKERMKTSRKEFKSGISKATIDTAKIESLIKEIGNVHSDFLYLEFEHYRNIRAICTKEQAIKFDSIGKNRMHAKELQEKMTGKHRRQSSAGRN